MRKRRLKNICSMDRIKENKFDLKEKQTPYQVPEHFFNEMQDKIIEKALGRLHRRLLLKRSLMAFGTAAILAVAVYIPVKTLLQNGSNEQQIAVSQQVDNAAPDEDDAWINSLKDDDLETMASIADNDEFLK